MASQVPIPPPKPKQLPLGYETFSDKAIRKTKEQPLVPIGQLKLSLHALLDIHSNYF